jgi:hypothetical protein
MESLKQVLKRQFSLLVFVFISFLYLFEGHINSLWKENLIIRNDVVWYYSYLPATFIKKDPLWGFYEEKKDEFNNNSQYWAHQTDKGTYAPKMSMGKAFMDLPFFLLADIFVQFSSVHERTGFSTPYHYLMLISSIFYALLGLFMLRKWLRNYYDDWIVGITLIAIAVGTNLLFYSVHEASMSHPYNFCLFALILYFYPKWLAHSSYKRTIILGLCIGLLVLIRPINILLLLPIFIINTKSNPILHLKQLIVNKSTIFLLVFAFLVWVPQMVFWKIQSDHWLYYSYLNESFFWLNSHVFDGLFSFRKGWFIYTPMAMISVIGIALLFKTHRSFFWAYVLFLPLFLYVTFSWWNWWYGGGFGARTLIDILPLMAFSLAAAFQWIGSRRWRLLYFIIPLFFVFLNYFQTWQYRNGIIHFEAMTYRGYKTVFLKTYTPIGYWEQLVTPDLENSIRYGEEKERKPIQ